MEANETQLPSVSISIPRDQLDLSESDLSMFAAVGYFTNSAAALEFLLDSFIFEYGKRKTKLVVATKNFPFKMDEKISFFIEAHLESAKLRTCGDADDWLCLNSIGYIFEEIWEIRNHLIHGNIHGSKHDDGTFSFNSSRYERAGKNKYCLVKYTITKNDILKYLDDIQYLKSLLHTRLSILDGKDPKTEKDIIEKNRAETRNIRQELLKYGIEIDKTGILRAFIGETT